MATPNNNALQTVNKIVQDILPKVKKKAANDFPGLHIKPPISERSFEEQLCLLLKGDPSLVPPLLKQELNQQINDMIMVSIVHEKIEKHQQLMHLLHKWLEEKAAFLEMLKQERAKEKEDPAMPSGATQREAIYFEYAIVLIMKIAEDLIANLTAQSQQLTTLDKQLTSEIGLLETVFDSAINGVHDFFVKELPNTLLDLLPMHGELLHRCLHALDLEGVQKAHEDYQAFVHKSVADPSLKDKIFEHTRPIFSGIRHRQGLIKAREEVRTTQAGVESAQKQLSDLSNRCRSGGVKPQELEKLEQGLGKVEGLVSKLSQVTQDLMSAADALTPETEKLLTCTPPPKGLSHGLS